MDGESSRVCPDITLFVLCRCFCVLLQSDLLLLCTVRTSKPSPCSYPTPIQGIGSGLQGDSEPAFPRKSAPKGSTSRLHPPRTCTSFQLSPVLRSHSRWRNDHLPRSALDCLSFCPLEPVAPVSRPALFAALLQTSKDTCTAVTHLTFWLPHTPTALSVS